MALAEQFADQVVVASGMGLAALRYSRPMCFAI